jgi:hypothetical protein
MYRSSDFSYSQFPIGLTFTVTPLEKTTTIVNGRPSAPPVLSIEFRNDMLRRPHMTHKGRCIVDVRIHASPPPPPGGMIVQLEVSATGDLANRILPACQLVRYALMFPISTLCFLKSCYSFGSDSSGSRREFSTIIKPDSHVGNL